MNIKPEEDGITHINCYSKGKTELGRFLSNFAYSPFECSDGKFNSIEGYWYWLGSNHSNKDILRTLSGWQAKEVGRSLRAEDWPKLSDFQDKIFDAVRAKFNANIPMRKLLVASTLPLIHYYLYGTKVHQDSRSDWLWKRIENKRNDMQILQSSLNLNK
jgi:predicted NAD-dependent protein-ADP-ribosyltransferase YbiA (DUF1768 family)